MSSINTNYSALVALQTLRATQSELLEVSGRVNTGLKVANATDNAGLYSIAQGLRARMATQSNLRDGMDRMSTTIDAALNGADNVQTILIEMRTRASAVATGNLTTAQIATLGTEFQGLRDQINAIVIGAQLNSVNAIGDSTQSFLVRINDVDLTQVMTVTGFGLAASSLGVDTLALTATNATTIIGTISTAIGTVNTAMGALGSKAKLLSMMRNFNQKLSDSVEKTIGQLVDADLPRESSRLQALQTKQQLNAQTLAIANQQPQVLLQLFR
jgi:flagellin